MLEMLGSGIVGSIVGAIARLTPEFLNFFNKKNERSHELEMFKVQTELEKVKGEFKVEEKYVDYSVAELNTIATAMKAEAETASSVANSYPIIGAISAGVRPGIAITVFSLYVILKITMIIFGITTGVTFATILGIWTPEDMAMLNMILSYYYVNRTIEKYRKTS